MGELAGSRDLAQLAGDLSVMLGTGNVHSRQKASAHKMTIAADPTIIPSAALAM